MTALPTHKDPILIVGAGVFGLSTALQLKQRGFEDITVIDRMLAPVPDGSSCDVSRIIRHDYTDPFYAKMAREAVDIWKSSELYKPHYYPAGYVLCSEEQRDEFLDQAKEVLRKQNQPYSDFRSNKELQDIMPMLKDIVFPFTGYVNQNAGWANAAGAIGALAARCSALGVNFICGKAGTMTSLKIGLDNRIQGVNVVSGAPLLASRVILATGAWTNRYLNLDQAMTSSAQPLGFIQLTKEEAEYYKDRPVVDNMTTGVFVFPPTPDTHLLKIARHSHGFENQVRTQQGRVFSAPARDTNNALPSYVPQDADEALRHGLRQLVPGVAERPWLRRRLCWYAETPTGDFIVDNHDSIDGLFIATGGSGQ